MRARGGARTPRPGARESGGDNRGPIRVPRLNRATRDGELLRHGRAPHQLSLRVTYEGYAKNPEDPDAPIPREGTLAVDWEAAEESSAVLERIDAQMRTLPFNHKGQVVALRLDVDDRAGSASNASSSPNGGSAGNGANGTLGAHQRTSSGNLLKDVFGAGGLTSFLLGGGDDGEAAAADPKKNPKLPRPHPRRETGR